jgi:hypothetical protein
MYTQEFVATTQAVEQLRLKFFGQDFTGYLQ